MLRYTARRLLWSIPIVLVASVLVFVAVKSTTDPGALRAPGIRAEDQQRLEEQLGLNKPGFEQYTTWLGNFVTGDFGDSLKTRQPVWPDLKTAIWNTFQLGIVAFGFSITLGVIIGTISAVRQYSWFDSASTGLSFFGLSIPPFFFGLILQIILVLQFEKWFGETPFFTSRMNKPGEDGFGVFVNDQPIMARGKVRYVGEAVAAVAAQDLVTARRALALRRSQTSAGSSVMWMPCHRAVPITGRGLGVPSVTRTRHRIGSAWRSSAAKSASTGASAGPALTGPATSLKGNETMRSPPGSETWHHGMPATGAPRASHATSARGDHP